MLTILRNFADLAIRTLDAFTAAQGMTKLGLILPVIIPGLVWVNAIWRRSVELRREKAPSPLRQAYDEAWALLGKQTIKWTFIFYAVVFLCFMMVVISADQDSLRSTKKGLEARRHDLIRGDPVVYDVRATLAAFTNFRRAIGNDATCEIRLTVPRDFSGELPSTLSMLANSATGCGTNTLSTEDPDPEVEKQRKSGMLTNTVVVHIRKDQKGGMQLTDALGSLMRLETSYDLPPNSPSNCVWFQFGVGAKWNSERR